MKILLYILLGTVGLMILTAFIIDIKWYIKIKRIENRCHQTYLRRKNKEN